MTVVEVIPPNTGTNALWGDSLPGEWTAQPLKRLAIHVSRGNTPDYVDDGLVRVLNQACIQRSGLRLDACKYHAEVSILGTKGELLPNDIVINSTGTGTLGRVQLFASPGSWMADGHVTIVRCDSRKLEPRFLRYVLSARPVQDYIYAALIVGATNQIELNVARFRAMPVPCPPLAEQRAIAAFLERETARIDVLVAKRKGVIASLDEASRSTIEALVTSASAPMWRIRHILTRIEQGWSPQCDNRSAAEGEWGVLKAGCVNGLTFQADQNKALPEDQLPRTEYLVIHGDILMSRANTKELLGSAVLVRAVPDRILLCDKLYRLIPDRRLIDPEFLVYVLNSSIARRSMEAEATGSSDSMQNIGQDTVRNLRIPLPPVVDQRDVAARIGGELRRIGVLIQANRLQLERLQERRQALITAAVTGQIDVTRGAAA